MKSVLTLLSACLPAILGAQVSQEDWQGIWAYDPAWCAVADKIGSANPAPIALTATEFRGYENSCDIMRVQPVGDLPAWSLGLECQSEGDMYEQAFLVMVHRENTLWLWDGGAEPTRFERCDK